MTVRVRPGSPRRAARPAVDRSLLHLRLLLACVLAVFAGTRLRDGLVADAVATLVLGAVVPAVVVVERAARRVVGPWLASAGTVAADLALALAVAWVAGVRPDSPGALVLVLPLIEAAMRHGVRGLTLAWLATAFAVAAWTGLSWTGSPVEVEASVTLLGVLVLTALPTAQLAEHLVDRVERYADAHDDAVRRADLLALLLEGIGSMASPRTADVEAQLVAGATALLGTGATVGLQPAGGVGSDRVLAKALELDGSALVERSFDRNLVAVSLGRQAAKVLLGESSGSVPTMTIEAIEVLAAHARIAHSASARYERSLTEAARWAERARTDPLTGLLNRGALADHLAERLGRRAGPATAVVFADVDGLKQVNDRRGHDAGDALLTAVAGKLRACFPGALVGRVGGDEFVLLLEPGPGDTVEAIAARAEGAVTGDVVLRGEVVGTMAVSVGVAVAEAGDGRDADELLRAADARMYAHKRIRRRSRPAVVG